ncbi:MAG: hypothetical protein AB7D38_02980 [Sulfurimonas sp.]|uniref:hypothetical protein n=1 Tax=Sulfurimonas sp. TaxID=2022749 RepID=UPI003D10FE0D
MKNNKSTKGCANNKIEVLNNLTGIYSNKADLDKFYTKPYIALQCIQQLKLNDYDFIIEPSAGNGSFFDQINHDNKEGIDLLPEDNQLITQQDWFNYTIDPKYKSVLVIGNPPFGKRNNLSKAFIAHAASFANVKTIAFILPDVFQKYTLQKAIPSDFRLKKILNLPDDSFLLDGKSYHVPCSFFVFERSEGDCLRFDPTKYEKSHHFSFATKEDYDFFIKGAAPSNPIEIPSANNRGYYIKVVPGINIETIKNNFRLIIWNGLSSVSGGVAWFTKPEIIKIYQKNLSDNAANNHTYQPEIFQFES